MGYNTKVVILFSNIEQKNGQYIINKINKFFYFPDSYYQLGDRIPPFQQFIEEYPHSRGPINILHGNFRYLDREGFFKHLLSLDWRWLDPVQVLLKGDEQYSYSLYVIKDNKFIEVYKGEQ
jgi:hypothetical protein